ncbi:MAG TPA: alpha-L-fucosidase [Lentisphaeria bacterium]|nr:MAG: alpha-L-fucosidase [Lentisphaerae bacterium GWF2_49_21]HBC87919.1 alpha-L-fucosidase [Lentisphaeria bacterium]
MKNSKHKTSDRMQWFQEARFGISLHFGLYTIPARGEWVRSSERMTVDEYQKYFDSFNPDKDCCREWAKLAKKAGAKYCVLTTKHHDGFCLFDTKLSEYSSINSPAKRDIVKEYVEACREEGLKVGLYYSLVDWHHPDYPAFGDRQHPLRHDPDSKERDKNCVWEKYLEYMHGQVMELMSNYGKIDLMVFDFSYWDFIGEKWNASELVRKIRKLQPDILINDRLGCEAIKEANPPAYVGDYDQSEQDIPREPVKNKKGENIPWESWFTVNNSWCFDPNDRNFKTPSNIIRALVNCVSKGGNLLLNMSPDAKGHINRPTVELLENVGAWLDKNGESIYGCRIADFAKPEWGRFTQKGNILYAHLFEQVVGHVNLPGMRGAVKDGRLLANGTEVIICDYWNPGIQTFDSPDDIFFNIGKPTAFTFPLPDRSDTVIRVELTDEKEKKMLKEEYQEDFKTSIRRVPF